MNSLVAATIGSGTLGQTRAILPAIQRGSEPLGEGLRVGTQVMIANPEDLNSVDIFIASGVFVGSTAIQIWGPEMNPLARQRTLIIDNVGPTNDSEVFIGPTEASVGAPSGFRLNYQAGHPRRLELPLLHNVQVWARSVDGVDVHIIAY